MLRKNYGLIFVVVFMLVYLPFFQQYGVGLVKEDSADFPSFYFGAKLAFIEKVSPYVEKNLKEGFKEYTENNGDYFPYLYAPPSLVLFVPFMALSYRDARLVMLVVNHLLLLLFIYIFLFKILRIKYKSFFSPIFVAYIFLFAPLYVTLDIGQVNIVILVLISLSWWFAREERHPIWIALPLSFAVILKLYPILFLIPLFWDKKYKAIGYTLGLIISISCIATLFLPETTWATWYSNIGSKGYTSSIFNLSINTPANQSMFGFFLRAFFGKNIRFAPIWVVPEWFAHITPYVASGTVFLISFLVSFWISRSILPLSISRLDMSFSLWSFVSFLIAPISWDHHLLFIVPAVAVLLHCLWQMEEKRYLLILSVSAAAIVLAIPYPYNSPSFRLGIKTLMISVPLYLVILLWLQLVFFLFTITRRKALVQP